MEKTSDLHSQIEILTKLVDNLQNIKNQFHE